MIAFKNITNEKQYLFWSSKLKITDFKLISNRHIKKFKINSEQVNLKK